MATTFKAVSGLANLLMEFADFRRPWSQPGYNPRNFTTSQLLIDAPNADQRHGDDFPLSRTAAAPNIGQVTYAQCQIIDVMQDAADAAIKLILRAL